MTQYDPRHADKPDTVETGQHLSRLFCVEQLGAISVEGEADKELSNTFCRCKTT